MMPSQHYWKGWHEAGFILSPKWTKRLPPSELPFNIYSMITSKSIGLFILAALLAVFVAGQFLQTAERASAAREKSSQKQTISTP